MKIDTSGGFGPAFKGSADLAKYTGRVYLAHGENWGMRNLHPAVFEPATHWQSKLYIIQGVADYLDVEGMGDLISIFINCSIYLGEESSLDEIERSVHDALDEGVWTPQELYETLTAGDHDDVFDEIVINLMALIATWPGVDIVEKSKTILEQRRGKK